MAVTMSVWAMVCARVTFSPANRAIPRSEIHNAEFFALILPRFLSPQQLLIKLFTSQLIRLAKSPLDANFLELPGAGSGNVRRRRLFASREFQQTDQFFDLGFIQPMQRLFYLVPNGGVEFLQEIEPGLCDVTKNLPAVIGRALPAH